MSWYLFLDDDRNPVKIGVIQTLIDLFMGTPITRIARTTQKAKKLCDKYGCPAYISFDHDLGENSESSGHAFAQWLVNKDLDNGGYYIPTKFTFRVHTDNPIGKANIEGLLNIYLKRKRNGGSFREIRKFYQ